MLARFLVLLILFTTAIASHAEDATAAVAANFTSAFQRLAAAFNKTTGHRVTASFGATGSLYAQIHNGAPFDMLLSADEKYPRQLEEQKLGVSGTRFTYAVGRLALWSPKAGQIDDRGEILRNGNLARLAIANPKVAPYGVAAEETLRNLGLWTQWEPRLVQGESITQTFQFVSSGNASLGFVALAQVRALPKDDVGSYWLVPEKFHTPLRQDAILVQHGAHNAAARAFLEYLRSPEAKAIIEELGYTAGS